VTDTPFDSRSRAALGRQLVRTAREAALGTVDADGGPNVSHIASATLADGAPLLLMSDLSAHTRNLKRDPRASLLYTGTTERGADTNTRPRISLRGTVAPVADRPLARARFLRRHPDAALYIDFGDFHLMRFDVEAVHIVGGFARAAGLRPERILAPPDLAEAIAGMDDGACEHMNDDHRDALAVIARHAGGEGEEWTAIGIDPQGIDLSDGERIVRAEFETPVGDGKGLRLALKVLADRARAAL